MLYGGNESDKLHGEADHDLLVGYDGADELYGEDGDDELSGGKGRDFLDGGDGDDDMDGGLGADVLYGGTGDDTLIGDSPYLKGANWYPSGIDVEKMAGDLLYGGAGADKILGNHGDDHLYGGTEADFIYGGYDNDHLFGETGDDVLDGGKGDDYMDGGEGADRLTDQDDGSDIMFGRAGDDDLNGGKDDDILDGGDDNDTLTGEDGNDILRGGAGSDHLYGDNGEGDPGMDLLEGGIGDARLDGGGDSDMYVFSLGDGHDRIQDDGADGSANTVVFKFGSDQISNVERKGTNLVISYGTSDSLTIIDYYTGASSSGYTLGDTGTAVNGAEAQNAIAQISFEDDVTWNRDKIYELAPPSDVPIPDPFVRANLPYFVNALLSRDHVRSVGKHQLTFTFATSVTEEKNSYLFNDESKAAVRAALAKFSEVSDLTFTEVASSENADLRYFLDDLTSAELGAFAGYASSVTGNIHLNSNLYAKLYLNEFGESKTKRSLNEGEFGFEVLLHETGHALGLKHPFESPLLPIAENKNANTVMSYTRTADPARQLAPFDVAALQFLYGVAPNKKPGDDTYTFADKYVYDAAGTDVFDASQETEGVYVDLAQGGWSSVGARNASILAPKQTYIGHGTQIESAIGGGGNDHLSGNALANTLVGGGGDDSLVGNGGDDVLQGGGGMDTYRFRTHDGQDIIADADGLSRIELPDVTADQVYWHGGYLYHGTEGARIAIEVSQIGELVIGGVSHVGQAIVDTVRIILGTAGNDSLVGSNAADRLSGIDGDDMLSGLGGMDRIEGGGGDDALDGGVGDDLMYGGTGNDVQHGGADNDAMNGGAGDDSMYGDAGDDVLDGNAGNDQLYGGTGTGAGGGNDTFRFSRGGGQDTIYESTSDADEDRIQMIELSDQELAFSLVGNDLLISIIGTEDSLTVSRYFESDARTIETIGLAGGVSLNKNDVFSRALINYVGTSGNDYLWSSSPNSRLDGKEGDDTLAGGNGYSVFIGGRGNDSLYGSSGKDSYVFNAGDGQDLLRDGNDAFGGNFDQVAFGPGLTAADLVFVARADLPIDDPDYWSDSSNDLIVKVRNSTDRLTITDFFSYGRIESFTFSDGTLLTSSDVLELIKRTTGSGVGDNLRGADGADSISAVAGDDKVFGFGGDDWIDGGEGDDYLFGGAGNDRLIGGKGRDSLYGDEGDDVLIASGDDYSVSGGAGDDVIDIGASGDSTGGVGVDGGAGSDTYILRSGMGRVTLSIVDIGAQALDVVEFADLNLEDVTVVQDGYRLTITSIANPRDTLEIYNLWGSSHEYESVPAPERIIDSVRFANGSEYTIEQIIRMSFHETSFSDRLRGTSADDTLSGGVAPDVLWGHVGNDVLRGGEGDDALYGMQGSDILEGGAGDDILDGSGDWATSGDGANTLIGGAGNDRNIGGNGNDTFIFGRGDGSDSIENLGTFGMDTLQFEADVLPEDVELYRDGADLVAVIDGSNTQARVKFFFTHSNRAVEQISFTNGTVWTIDEISARAIITQVDELFGTAGDDVFIVDNAYDTVTEAATAGIDEVRSSVSYFLPQHVENFTATGILNTTIQGNSTANVLKGNAGDNVFRSGGGIDHAIGGVGSDTYYVDYAYSGQEAWLIVKEHFGEGYDTLIQVDGSWINSSYSLTLPDNVERLILGASSSTWVNGLNEVNPRLGYGNSLDNDIRGDKGVENYLDGGEGRDVLVGGSRVDVFEVDLEGDLIIDYYAYDSGKNSSARSFNGSETLFRNGDLVRSSASHYALGQNVEHLQLVGLYAVNGTGNGLNNVIVGNENANLLAGGAGNDQLFDAAAKSNQYGSPADSSQYAYDADTLLGGDGDDQITAFNGEDRLEGGGGNDVVTALGGLATLVGGVGNDTLSGSGLGSTYQYGLGDGHDVVHAKRQNSADGKDRLVLDASINPGNVTLQRVGADGADLLLEIDDGGSVLVRSYFAVDPYSDSGYRNQTLSSIEFSSGTTWSRNAVDRHFGLPTDPDGTPGNDTLIGSASRNLIYGWGGNDLLIGEAGNDHLDGGDGNDTLDGGFGADVLAGGDGDDLYREVDGAQIVEAVDGGTDTLEVELQGFLGDNVEFGLVVTGAGAVLWGSSTANTLVGNMGDDVLYGGEGDDRLEGRAGVDTLDGGLGNDLYVYQKGDGPDSIYAWDVQSAIDTLRLGALDTEVIGSRSGDLLLLKIKGSTDQISVIDYYAPPVNEGGVISDAKIDRIEFSNGMVWDKTMIQTMVNRASSNRAPVIGGSIPALTAYRGSAFTYTIPSSAITDPDAWDSVTYSVKMANGSAMPAWLSFDTASRTLSGIAPAGSASPIQLALQGTDTYGAYVSRSITVTVAAPNIVAGTAAANTLNGGSGSDSITGVGGDDTLFGHAGNDRLDGGIGADQMTGGAGDDIYIVDSALDVVTESAGGGYDRVESSVSFSLSVHVEQLTITGAANATATGNSSANVLIGNSAWNLLDGGQGADTMYGGLGEDAYIVDNIGDTIVEQGSDYDAVESSVTYTLFEGLESLTLTGTANINGTGNSLDNELIGNEGDNYLTGGGGNDYLEGAGGLDSLEGGAGNDVYRVDNIDDEILESLDASGGIDTMWTSVNDARMYEGIERLYLDGTTAVKATGSYGNDLIRGNGANNRLYGLHGHDNIYGDGGDDFIWGGEGNDTVTGGSGNDSVTDSGTTSDDVYRWGKGAGQDRITDYGGASDRLEVSLVADKSQLWFEQAGNDLKISVIGLNDSVTVGNWFDMPHRRIESITVGAATLSDTKVQALVNAMADFGAPAAGQTTLPANYQAALNPLIASSWA